MSIVLQFEFYVSGDATDKASFFTALETSATSAGYVVDGTTFTKDIAYTADTQAYVIIFYNLVAAAFIAGLNVQVTRTSNVASWV